MEMTAQTSMVSYVYNPTFLRTSKVKMADCGLSYCVKSVIGIAFVNPALTSSLCCWWSSRMYASTVYSNQLVPNVDYPLVFTYSQVKWTSQQNGGIQSALIQVLYKTRLLVNEQISGCHSEYSAHATQRDKHILTSMSDQLVQVVPKIRSACFFRPQQNQQT
jgi:hypothetical protein